MQLGCPCVSVCESVFFAFKMNGVTLMKLITVNHYQIYTTLMITWHC